MATLAESVQALFTSANDTANTMMNNMVDMGNNAAGAFSELFLEGIDLPLPTLLTPVLSSAGAAPVYAGIATAITDTGPAPGTSGIDVPLFVDPPGFNLSDPGYIAPAAPSAALPAAPSGIPVISSPAMPLAPSTVLPPVPVFAAIAIPTAPAVDIPPFTVALEIDAVTQPTETFSYIEAPYQDALLDEVKVKLMSDLVNGGYGIEPADEILLWNREREREQRATEALLQDTSRQMAARGFMLPPGALFAQLAAAQTAGLEKTSSVNRDIGLKRADMYVENRKFTISQVKEVEQMLITYWGYMQERALNTAKAVVDYGIKLFDARLAGSNYKLARYKAQADVYETSLKAALAHLEEYKARVEGARLSVEVQRVQAEVYNLQLAGVQSMINLYNAQLGAVRTQVDIETLRLSAFKTSVETYAIQVQAKTAEFGLYEAQIKAAKVPIEVYSAQVQAYASRIAAYEAQVRAQHLILATQIEPAKLETEQYRAKIAKFAAEVERYSADLRNAAQTYDARIRSYITDREIFLKFASYNVEASKAQADVTLASSKLAGDHVLARGNQMITSAHAFAAVQAALASAYGSVGSSALSVTSGLLAETA